MEKEASTNMKTFPAHIKIPTGYAMLRPDKQIRSGDIILFAHPIEGGAHWGEVVRGGMIEGSTPSQIGKIACFKLKPKKTQ